MDTPSSLFYDLILVLSPPQCQNHAIASIAGDFLEWTPESRLPKPEPFDPWVVHWFAQGGDSENWCLLARNRLQWELRYGARAPKGLMEWCLRLQCEGSTEELSTTKVALATKNGYLAWNCSGYIFEYSNGIREALSTYGPDADIRSASFGRHNSWYLEFTNGQRFWSIADECAETKSFFSRYKIDIERGVFKHLVLSPSCVDEYIFVDCHRTITANCRDKETLFQVVDSTYTDVQRRVRNRIRQEERQRFALESSNEAYTKSAKRCRGDDEFLPAPMDISQLAWQDWRFRVESAFKGPKKITGFPFPGASAFSCDISDCRIYRELSPLSVCKHEVKALFEASGSYNFKWLKSERNKWHADRFGPKCDPRCKEVLVEEANEMFCLLGTIIDDEIAMEDAL